MRHRTCPLFRGLIVVFLASMSFVQPAAAAEADWSGSWGTKWKAGGARLDLNQSGDQVTGHYPLFGGEVVGKAAGTTLEGRWIEGARSGSFVFTMSPDGRTFTGRYGNGEWWTGERTRLAAPTARVDRSDVRETFRTFIKGGNLAKSGLDEEIGTSVAVLDFRNRPDTILQGQKVLAARELFELVSLTTFQIWELPGKLLETDIFTAKLQQAGTDVVLPLSFVRGSDGQWAILMPDESAFANVRKALLARYGGRPPAPSAYLKLRTARDTMMAFQAAFATWDRGGRQRVLDTLDSSQLFAATRDYEADLAAQYIKAVLDRVSNLEPQESPDDPQDSQPFIVFSHPAGNIVIAPTEQPDKTAIWRFTPETLSSIRRVHAAVEPMPPLAAGTLEGPHTTFFARRSWVRSVAPGLMRPIGPVEGWQILAGILGVLVCSLAAAVGTAFFLKIFQSSRKRSTEAQRSLRWPLLLTTAAVLFKLLIPLYGWPEEVRQITAPIHALIIGVFGAWAAWELINMTTQGLLSRARRTHSYLDDMTITLVGGAARICVLFVAAAYVATQLAIPTNGILAGLGLGGLAVAIASKETLSNLFGAGILVADRPFNKGDLITVGDIQGTVEHVGIRSTRIRTAEDTQMIIPNGKLSDASINNWGHRKYRLFETKVRVPYGTTASKVEAFQAKLRRLFAEDEAVAADRTEVGISSLSDTGMVIDVSTYFRAAPTERAVKNRLMLAVIQLAEQENVVIAGT
ncbi:MAG TPA: mechanosensitive ion channel family protein [Nitrospira sp.]|nr:mechanosensitive ion channel family protein [Nitrospira sp.]